MIASIEQLQARVARLEQLNQRVMSEQQIVSMIETAVKTPEFKLKFEAAVKPHVQAVAEAICNASLGLK